MIESMTGYGKAIYLNPNKRITVELRSINSKQLDLIIRMPSIYRDQENIVRSEISKSLERGKIDLTVTIDNLIEESSVTFNKNLLSEYKKQIEDIISELNLPPVNDLLPLLLRMPDAMKTQTQEAGEEETEGLLKACHDGVKALHDSRLEEGRKLYVFFKQKTSKIRELLKEIDQYEAERIPKIRERLEEQLSKLESIEYDKSRLEQELIFYIEKLDVTEEKTRLESHLNYFDETLGKEDEEETGGKGKKLGFIAQEIGREINTLGSKSNNAEMQKIVVMMKDELEQIKEQVLNVL